MRRPYRGEPTVWVWLTGTTRCPPFALAYQLRLERGTLPSRAKLAIARKLIDVLGIEGRRTTSPAAGGGAYCTSLADRGVERAVGGATGFNVQRIAVVAFGVLWGLELLRPGSAAGEPRVRPASPTA